METPFAARTREMCATRPPEPPALPGSESSSGQSSTWKSRQPSSMWTRSAKSRKRSAMPGEDETSESSSELPVLLQPGVRARPERGGSAFRRW
jgi:hypothetical protein